MVETKVSTSHQQEWINPVDGIITSIGGLRENPVTFRREFHDGVDIACPIGTEVRAVLDGKVLDAGKSSSYGNYIKLSMEDGYRITFAHLSRVLVSKGDTVIKGQTVALSGNTGRSTGPHLHYSIFKDGQYQNPSLYVSLPYNDGTSMAMGNGEP